MLEVPVEVCITSDISPAGATLGLPVLPALPAMMALPAPLLQVLSELSIESHPLVPQSGLRKV